MTDDDVPISAWLEESPTDPAVVAQQYDEWAQSYDGDLADWSYRRRPSWPRTSSPGSRRPTRCSTSGAAPGSSAGSCARGGFTGRLRGLDISQASLDVAGESGVYDAGRAGRPAAAVSPSTTTASTPWSASE